MSVCPHEYLRNPINLCWWNFACVIYPWNGRFLRKKIRETKKNFDDFFSWWGFLNRLGTAGGLALASYPKFESLNKKWRFGTVCKAKWLPWTFDRKLLNTWLCSTSTRSGTHVSPQCHRSPRRCSTHQKWMIGCIGYIRYIGTIDANYRGR